MMHRGRNWRSDRLVINKKQTQNYFIFHQIQMGIEMNMPRHPQHFFYYTNGLYVMTHLQKKFGNKASGPNSAQLHFLFEINNSKKRVFYSSTRLWDKPEGTYSKVKYLVAL